MLYGWAGANLEIDLSAGKIEKEQGADNYRLKAPRLRGTHQLIEWLMGRLDRVEVLAPSSLRQYVVEQLDAMRARYSSV